MSAHQKHSQYIPCKLYQVVQASLATNVFYALLSIRDCN